MKRINVTRSSIPDLDKYIELIKPLWSSRNLTNSGEYHSKLETELSKYLHVKETILFTNGHIALEYALEAIGLTGEIITTPFTFASTTQAIIRTGNTPVFCDIKENDYTIDETKIEALISERTAAIMPVHVYGNICNVEEIERIAKKHNVKVIYDAAHVFGVKYKNKGIGSFGDISMFSFHATKVFHTIEGGALTYNNMDYKTPLNALKNFGQITPEDIQYIGGNGKMDEFRAAMGLCNLEIVDSEILKRKNIYDRYILNLKDIKGIKLNRVQENVQQNYAYFPVLFFDYKYNRDEILELLRRSNIYARKYFFPLTNTFKAYQGLFKIDPTPIAEAISKNILTLPLYPDLSLEEVDSICNIIKEGVL